MKAKTAPRGLQASGRALWRDVVDTYELRPDELQALAAACRCADELERLETAFASAEVVVTGSKGQTRAHPLLEEIRRHRTTMSRLLAVAGLAEADHDPQAERSAAGRGLARQRWGQRGA